MNNGIWNKERGPIGEDGIQGPIGPAWDGQTPLSELTITNIADFQTAGISLLKTVTVNSQLKLYSDSTVAVVGHVNSTNISNAGFFQDDTLHTYINSASAKEVHVRNNNAEVATFSGSAISLLKPVTITGNTVANGRIIINQASDDIVGGLILASADTNNCGIYRDNGGAGLMHIFNQGTNIISLNGSAITLEKNTTINGSLSKSSGSFRIPHPLKGKEKTHELVHSFVEAPQADNIYRGKVNLVDGKATVNIDTVAGMTEGTFTALNREVQIFTTNESGFCMVRGSVEGNIITIEAQVDCTDLISWMVIGERHDRHMYDTAWTDDDGKVIVEPEVVKLELDIIE
jgi:hypothetical protein